MPFDFLLQLDCSVLFSHRGGDTHYILQLQPHNLTLCGCLGLYYNEHRCNVAFLVESTPLQLFYPIVPKSLVFPIRSIIFREF
jgi:hypothetical protein